MVTRLLLYFLLKKKTTTTFENYKCNINFFYLNKTTRSLNIKEEIHGNHATNQMYGFNSSEQQGEQKIITGALGQVFCLTSFGWYFTVDHQL